MINRDILIDYLINMLLRLPEATALKTPDGVTIQFNALWATDPVIVTFHLANQELEHILQLLPDQGNDSKIYIQNDNNCEIPITMNPRDLLELSNDFSGMEFFNTHDTKNQLQYVISLMSGRLLFKILKSINNRKIDITWHVSGNEENFVYDKAIDLLHFIRNSSIFSLPRCFSIKIKSEHFTNKWEQLTSSFFYHIAYNKNISLLPLYTIDNFINYYNQFYIYRQGNLEIGVPHRAYNDNLVRFYQAAISSDNPMLQYLLFYRILEYFYEDVANQFLSDFISDKISGPDFSFNNKTDWIMLVKDIKKQLKVKSEEAIFEEKQALILVLKTYINIETLIGDLHKWDTKLVEYYKTNIVDFSGGQQINLSSPNVYKSLADRLYKTRNSVVHGKNTITALYKPIDDDDNLAREIPLIRLISEQIIFKTSTLP